MPIQKIRVFLDTGLQRHFIPLLAEDMEANDRKICPPQLLATIQDLEDWKANGVIPADTLEALAELSATTKLATKDCPPPVGTLKPWLRYRLGHKVWTLSNGKLISLFGIWLFIETNTADGKAKGGISASFDRGVFYQRNGLTAQEKAEALEAFRQQRSLQRGDSPYVSEPAPSNLPLDLSPVLSHAPGNGTLSFGELSFELVFVEPQGKIRNVDLILDLGNTRTAALLYERPEDADERTIPIPPANFRMQFKPLRLRPNPNSGEFASVDDVSAGVADSWFVLHELDHQRYHTDHSSREPDLFLREWDVKIDEVKDGHWPFVRTKYEATGGIVERIPQMFMQISPVLVGDAAYQQFYGTYARNMVKVGAVVQQSSPKRFYWDDQPASVNWSMLLNEWDALYDDEPENAAALPTLQGDICRFINDRSGRVLNNLSEEIPSNQRPVPYPKEPRYPRQSTIVWFLLHILERAYAQANQTFKGTNFIPRRLRNVLITYPSGWTAAEVGLYRERCQEALDIFSTVNVPGGIQSPVALRLVSQDRSPDEAVAGQLPFIFSEAIRYPGQTIGNWIATMGRRRSDPEYGNVSTVRVMNFDIGGGTTDISIIEYRDDSDPNTGLNDLHTKLLFKDGQALAGDDLLKKIIEKIVLRGLSISSEALSDRIRRLFGVAPNDPAERVIRSRIVRNCLIPVATYCLANSEGTKDRPFSAKKAGVEKQSWEEFKEIVGTDANGNSLLFDIDREFFEFTEKELAVLIEETFHPLFARCALYAAAYEVDIVVFSGKTSELPHVREMAANDLPLEEERLLFARSFLPGPWYPFTNPEGLVSDAKTVTVVGAALYYALSGGAIANWTIHSDLPSNEDTRNEWGVHEAMLANNGVFLDKETDEATVRLLPNTVISRRRNSISSPEPVYKICPTVSKDNPPVTTFVIRRESNDVEGFGIGDETLRIVSATDQDGTDVTGNFTLKLHPYPNGVDFWQETGFFTFGETC